MWCAHCQADVAAEVTANRHRILCASCGCDLANSAHQSPLPQTEQAQQILDRWSHREMPAPASPGLSVSSVADPSQQITPSDSAASDSAAPDSAMPPDRSAIAAPVRAAAPITATPLTAAAETSAPETSPPETSAAATSAAAIARPVTDAGDERPEAAGMEMQTVAGLADEHLPHGDPVVPAALRADIQSAALASRLPADTHIRVDGPHGPRSATQDPPQTSNDPPRTAWSAEQPAHSTTVAPRVSTAREPLPADAQPLFTASGFDAQLEISRRQQRQAKWVVSTAQFLAYCGIGGLTVGTACVIWGYFGGVTNYLPMGWLVLSFGQMLLFLGMVTMFSCSVEQTSTDVTRQLAEIQKQLARIPLPGARRQSAIQTPHMAPLDSRTLDAGNRQQAETSSR